MKLYQILTLILFVSCSSLTLNSKDNTHRNPAQVKGMLGCAAHFQRLFAPSDANRSAVSKIRFGLSAVQRQEALRIVKEIPKLQDRFNKLSKNLLVNKQQTDLSDLPFEASDEFRAPKAIGKMRLRATQLDPSMNKTLLASYNILNDKEKLNLYFNDLFLETVLWMQKKARAEDFELLDKGHISEQAISAVIVRRYKARGVKNFTSLANGKLSYGRIDIDESNLDLERSNHRFRAAIKTGPFFDHTFDAWERDSHGAFTHMIQRDIVGQFVLSQTARPQDFWDYLSSAQGVSFWVDIFDSGKEGSINRPEYLTEYIVHNVAGELFE